MKYSTILLIMITVVMTTIEYELKGMDGSQAKAEAPVVYRLVAKNNSETMVSKLLVESSPFLQMRANGSSENSLVLDWDESLLSSFTLIDSLLILTEQKKIEAILTLDNKKFVGFITVLFYLELRELLDLSLQVYYDKITQTKSARQARVAVPSLVDLTASCIARNLEEFELGSVETLPAHAQAKIFQNTRLNYRNFDMLYHWMERLSAASITEEASQTSIPTKKSALIPLTFSREQYNSLGEIGHYLQETAPDRKQFLHTLVSLDGQEGKVKLAILRTMLFAATSSLSNIQRFKLAWRSAIHEQSLKVREAIFDYLAFFHFTFQQDPEFTTMLPAFLRLWTKPKEFSLDENIMLLKTQYKLAYEICFKRITLQAFLDHNLNRTILDYISPLSEYFLADAIIKLKDQLTKTPLRHLGSMLKFIATLISSNPLAVKQKFALSPILFPGEAELGFTTQWTLNYACLAKFSGISLTPTLIDDAVQQQLDEQFCKHVAYILTGLKKNIELRINQMQAAYPNEANLGLDQIRTRLILEHGSRITKEEQDRALTQLIHLLTQGARLNAQDQDGNTIAHKAFSSDDTFLVKCIQIIDSLGLGKVGMHCQNAKGETPLLFFHQLPITKTNYNNMSLIAKGTKQNFSEKQQAQIEKLSNSDIFKATSKCTDFYEVISVLDPFEDAKFNTLQKLQLAWFSALRETDPQRIDKLLNILSSTLNRLNAQRAHLDIPRVFTSNTEVLHKLCKMVKELQSGKLQLSAVSNEIDMFSLFELLKFSECLWKCLYKVKSNPAQNQKLIQCSRLDRACICIAEGADINCEDIKSNTTLHYAALTGNENLVKMLLQIFKGKINAAKKNKQNCTPLLVASQHPTLALELVTLFCNNVKITELDILAADASGKTALDYLREKGHEKHAIYRLLTGEDKTSN